MTDIVALVEEVLVLEWHTAEPKEGVHLQSIAVVVGHAEEGRIGVEREHALRV